MTFIVTSEDVLNRFVPPRLPAAPAEYNPQFIEQYSNILRLYFNQLTNLLGQLNTKDAAAALALPYGAFFQDGVTTLAADITNNSTTPIQVASTAGFVSAGTLLIESELINYTGKTPTTFTGITRGVYGTTNVAHTTGVAVTEAIGVASPTTSKSLPFTNTTASLGVELSLIDPARVICTTPGVYNFTFSVQLLNFTTTDDNVTLWFKKDGSDVAFSAGVVQVSPKHGSSPGATIASWNLVLDMPASSYIEMSFSSLTGNTVCATYAVGTAPTRPVSPSLILTATFVSALPP